MKFNRFLFRLPSSRKDWLWVGAAILMAALYYTGGIGKAHADVPYEEEAYHSSMKDTIPPAAINQWLRRNEEQRQAQAYYYRERGQYEYHERGGYKNPDRLPYRKAAPKVRKYQPNGYAEDGTPIYSERDIERICGQLGREGMTGQMVFYDNYYRRFRCRFQEGGSWLKLDSERRRY